MVRIEEDVKLDFKDVLIRPKRSTLKSRSEVCCERTFTFKHSKRQWTGVPIIVANMDTTGTFEMARALAAHKMLVAVHKHYTVADWIEFAKESPDCLRYVAVSSGTSDAEFEKLKEIVQVCGGPERLPFLCLDVANGYSEHFVKYIERVRADEDLRSCTIIAGNVVTCEMAEQLVISGADVVKIGIGPGSVCTTRKQTGVGYPQLSAVIECADAAHGLGGHVVSDGGCACPGDFAKALGAGGDFVMAGGMFAGFAESGGELMTKSDGTQVKMFYGMSSATAMHKYSKGVANYRASEGKAVEVAYKGPVEAFVLDLLGGIRSACTYVGASEMSELAGRTTFIRVTQQLNAVFGDSLKNNSDQRVTYAAQSNGAGERAAKRLKSDC